MTLAFPKPERRQRKAPARIERRTPMSRSRIQRQPPRRRERDRPFDGYTAWLHDQPCDGIASFPGHGTEADPCEGPIQQAHLRDMTGASRKELPMDSIPACRKLHDEYDGRQRGRFDGLSKFEKKSWMRGRIAVHNARFHAGVEVFG